MISSGCAFSSEQLVAFDAALIDAGISDYNLLRVSSILPADCTQRDIVDVRPGSPLLVAYGSKSSDVMGEKIASAVGIGIPVKETDVGVIMEYADVCDAETAEKKVREMVAVAMENHKIPYTEIKTSSIETVVSEEGWSTVISSVAMW